MSLVNCTCGDTVDVRRMTEEELSRLGVRLVNHAELILQCLHCEETWQPLLDESGILAPGYWKCPTGCND